MTACQFYATIASAESLGSNKQVNLLCIAAEQSSRIPTAFVSDPTAEWKPTVVLKWRQNSYVLDMLDIVMLLVIKSSMV